MLDRLFVTAQILLAHDLFGNNVDHFIIASSAAGGATGRILYILKHIKKIVYVAVSVNFVKNFEIGYLIALAHGVVLG